MRQVDPSQIAPSPEALTLVPAEFARKFRVIPMGFEESALIIATANPENLFALEELMFMTNRRVEVAIATPEAIG